MSEVTYSGKIELGGSGIGLTASHQVKPLLENGLLKRAYVMGTTPEFEKYVVKVPVVRGDYVIQDIMFDAVTSLIIKPSKLLQTWLSHCLFTMQSVDFEYRIVNCFSAHIEEQDELLRQATGQRMVHPLLKEKILRELKLATHILCPSEFVFQTLKKHGLAKKAKIIPFGVDTEKFTPGVKTDNKFRVLFIGRNWLRKGLPYLFLAWSQLRLKDAELVVITSRLPEGIEVPENTRVVEWVDDIIETYHNADIFVLPAIEDGCPLVTYEALACGVPVIVSNTTGTYQHIWDGTNGFVIKSGSVSDLANCIQFLYDRPKELARMKRMARKSVENLTWKNFESNYVSWIKSILNDSF